MFHLPATYRRLLRREVLDISLLIFISDAVIGIQIPIFPLYAISLGASLGVLGLLTSVLGISRVGSALPVGLMSDRFGPKNVLTASQLLFAVSCCMYAVAPSPGWLVPARIVHGVATMASFPMGIAYIGDTVEAADRTAAIGIYTAAMGSGFAVGPLLGSWVSTTSSYRVAYGVAAALAVIGVVWAWRRLLGRPVRQGPGRPRPALFDGRTLRALAASPNMVFACTASLVMSLSMVGAIFTFFPIYARQAGLTTLTIGSIFAWRALASATGRIPVGAIAPHLPARWLLAGVMLIEAGVLFGISQTVGPLALALLMIVEGISFGVFLVAGQAAVADASVSTNRGAAIGMFSLCAGVGETIGPGGLGLLAERAGIAAVFNLTAVLLVVWALATAALGTVLVRAARPVPDPPAPLRRP